MLIVAKDGTGHFTSIQAAVDACPETGRAPSLILVRRGVYEERVVIHRDNVRLVGESREETILTWSDYALNPDASGQPRGTFRTATLLVTGNQVEVENLTVRNDAGDGRIVGQAVAVYAAGDRGTWRNCRLSAHQDTLLCGPLMPRLVQDILPRQGRAPVVENVAECSLVTGRQYFEDCLIEGDIDFIFGSYRCWFERCTLVMLERGGYYTAANTPENMDYGFVFHSCRLTGTCPEGQAFLGRPWRRFARTVFLSCDMDEHVSPEGFQDWDEVRVITPRCAEWATTGARADLSRRHPDEGLLSREEAMLLSLPQVIGGADHWHPEKRVPTWFLCGDSTMADYPVNRAPMTGWGQALQPLLQGEVFVQNEAFNGRSSRSFIDEGRLEQIRLCLRPGDLQVIGFAHNDEKSDPERHTDPETTFPQMLRRYLSTARESGALAVLVTPVARRHFDPQGLPVPTHGAYPEAIRRLAQEEQVPLVDLERASMLQLRRLGPEGSRSLYCHVAAGHPHYPIGLQDNSHLHLRGAVTMAALFLEGLQGETWSEEAPSPEGTQAGAFRELIDLEDWVLSHS